MSLAESLLEELRRVDDLNDLHRLIASVARALGFQHYAMISHADLSSDGCGIIRIENYPAEWATRFVEDKLYLHDPVVHASQTTANGFPWSKIPEMIRLRGRQRAILNEGHRQGLGEGFTIPNNIPGQLSGSCSFVTRRGVALPPVSNCHVAQIVGSLAFECARRLSLPYVSDRSVVPLTPRQRDCLVLVARGYANKQIAHTLGQSERWVEECMKTIFRRYGVVNRTHAAICAIYDGQIGFQEIR